MSRAFVKEPDGDDLKDDQPDLPISPHPNFMTPAGHAAMVARLADLQAEREAAAAHEADSSGSLTDSVHLHQIDRHIRYVEARLDSAQVIDLTHQPRDRVAFGAEVEVVDDDDQSAVYIIVGEDEADVEHGKVSYVSPLARALDGHEVGDTVKWRRPAGDRDLEIVAIRYPDADT